MENQWNMTSKPLRTTLEDESEAVLAARAKIAEIKAEAEKPLVEFRKKKERIFAQLDKIDQRLTDAVDQALFSPVELADIRYIRELIPIMREMGNDEKADKAQDLIDRRVAWRRKEEEQSHADRLRITQKMETLLDMRIKEAGLDIKMKSKDIADREFAEREARKLAHMLFDGLMDRYIPPGPNVISLG
jgi:hypothetical protein